MTIKRIPPEHLAKGINDLIEKRVRGGKIAVMRACHRSAMLVRNTAIEKIQTGAKSGVVYEKYNPRRTHQASRAGEYPATDTGYLVNQITTQVKSEGTKILGLIISSAEYSKHLEYGTTTMLARPFMQPSLEINKKKIPKIFKQEGAIKRA